VTAMSSPNGLICFTNCLLPLEDGGLVEKDLWIDERRGVILDAQVRIVGYCRGCWLKRTRLPGHVLSEKRKTGSYDRSWWKYIEVN